MRSVSGPRNRLVLALASLFALLAAAWLGSASFGLAARWPGAKAVLPHGDSTPASLTAAHQQWLLPAASGAAVVAVLLGIWLLALQIPSRPSTPTLRLRDEHAAVLGALEPSVLERALAEHLEEVAGVLDASVRMTGSASSPWPQASVTIAEEAETPWVAEAVRERLADDVRTVLEVEPRQVDLLVHLRSAAAPSRAVIGDHGPSAQAPGPLPIHSS